MLFYEDFGEKVEDVFDRDYIYAFPLSLRVDTKDRYFMNYVHSSHFVPKPAGVGIDSECKFAYSRDNVGGSFVLSPQKLQVELQYEPRPFGTAGRFLRFRTRKSITSRVSPEEEKRYLWGLDAELETKASLTPELGHALRLIHDGVHMFPKVGVSTLFNKRPILAGVSYLFDKEAKHMSGPFEVLFGVEPYAGVIFYWKHQVRSFEYPGRLGFGVYAQTVFESLCDRRTAEGVTKRPCALPVEFVAESFVDMQKRNGVEGRTGMRVGFGKRHTMQAKLDSELRLATALSYAPKKGFKFVWSSQINLRKLVADPRNGIDYLGGFSLELDMSPL